MVLFCKSLAMAKRHSPGDLQWKRELHSHKFPAIKNPVRSSALALPGSIGKENAPPNVMKWRDTCSRSATLKANCQIRFFAKTIPPKWEVYYLILSNGQCFGYRRTPKVRGCWVARITVKSGSRYRERVLGFADDDNVADGDRILTFEQGKQRALEWFGGQKFDSLDMRPANSMERPASSDVPSALTIPLLTRCAIIAIGNVISARSNPMWEPFPVPTSTYCRCLGQSSAGSLHPSIAVPSCCMSKLPLCSVLAAQALCGGPSNIGPGCSPQAPQQCQ